MTFWLRRSPKTMVFCFVVLSFSLPVASAQDVANGLTMILRDHCVSYPKIKPLEAQRQGVHYELSSDLEEGTYEWYWSVKLSMNIDYQEVLNWDYYTASGRLVTTRREVIHGRWSHTYDKRAEGKWDHSYRSRPEDDKARQQLNEMYEWVKELGEESIADRIYSFGKPTCADSHYH